MYGSHAFGVYVAIGVMLFLSRVTQGLESERFKRCHSCGSRFGERHHPNCQWRNK